MHFNGKALDMKSTKMDSNKKPFYDYVYLVFY